MAPEQIYSAENLNIDQIFELMRDGALCLLPSDSSYILTGRVNVPGVSRDIDAILQRKDTPMSLAYGDLKTIAASFSLSNQAYLFFRKLTPGGLTFVAQPNTLQYNHFSKVFLHADGSIGVRLTESEIETRLAKRFPVPSVPIRSAEHKEISTLEEGWKIVSARCEELKIDRKIILIDGEVKYPGRISTVVREKQKAGFQYIQILREGAIPTEEIKRVAAECHYRGVLLSSGSPA